MLTPFKFALSTFRRVLGSERRAGRICGAFSITLRFHQVGADTEHVIFKEVGGAVGYPRYPVFAFDRAVVSNSNEYVSILVH
jgi:hypothetical protein